MVSQKRPQADGGGGEPLVLEGDQEVRAQAQEVPPKGPAGLAPGPFRAVHVQGQADDQGLGAAFIHQRKKGVRVIGELRPADHRISSRTGPRTPGQAFRTSCSRRRPRRRPTSSTTPST